MKRIVLISVVCAMLAMPAFADYSGGQVYYNRIGGYYSGNGGEFTLSSDGGPGLQLSLSAYSSLTKNQPGSTTKPSFQSFCLEATEFVTSPMSITVSDTEINESTGVLGSPGSGSHAVLGSMTYGDNLDARTAYLYTKFATGQLISAGYNYTAGPSRQASAAALQEAIWYIEGETGGVNNTFVALADDATTIGGATDEWVGKGIGDVRVLNMSTLGGGRAQDQLYLVPVPAAVLLGLLGLGAAGLKLRKFA